MPLIRPSAGQQIASAHIDQIVDLLTAGTNGPISPSALPTATQTTIGALKRPTLNLREAPFSAVGDGVADDTTAVVAWIAAALDQPTANVATTTRFATTGNYAPGGTYRITSPIVMQSILGLHIHGDGASTVFKADFTGQAAFQMDGMAYCLFENFRLTGSGAEALQAGIQLEWSGSSVTNRSTTHNRFYNVDIFNLKFVVGIGLGWTAASAGLQVSETSLWHCTVAGGNPFTPNYATPDATYWKHGILVGNGTFGNNLDNHIYFGGVSQCVNGITYNASSGALDGCVMGANATTGFDPADGTQLAADFNALCLGYFSVQNCRSEGSGRMFVSGSAQSGRSAMASYRIANIDWHANGLVADHYYIKHYLGGVLHLEGIQNLGAATVICYTNPGSTPTLSLLIDGIRSQTAYASAFIWTVTVTAHLRAGYEQTDAFGGGVGVVRDHIIANGKLQLAARNGSNAPVALDKASLYWGATDTVASDGKLSVGMTALVGAASFAASATQAQLMLGGGPWDGVTTGFYSATGSGTYLGINLASAFTGDALNISAGAAFKVRATYQGNVLASSSFNAPLLSSGTDGTAAGQIIAFDGATAGLQAKLISTGLIFTRAGQSTISATGAGAALAFSSQNTANNASLTRLAINSGDTATVTWSNALIAYSDGVNLQAGTTTGSKIGTGTTQKLGFWNATPAAQQTVTGSRSANAALASLLTALATVGIVVDSSTV